MSVRREVRATLVALLQAAPALVDVQVSPVPLGENQALGEAIWIERVTSRFDWRGLGPRAPVREDLVVELAVDAFRHGPRQQDACEEAVDRVDVLLQAIEDTIAADRSLGTGCASALVRLTDVRARPLEQGWAAQGTCRIEITNYPATP